MFKILSECKYKTFSQGPCLITHDRSQNIWDIDQTIWFEQKCLKMCFFIQILCFVISNIFQSDWFLNMRLFFGCRQASIKEASVYRFGTFTVYLFLRYLFSCFSFLLMFCLLWFLFSFHMFLFILLFFSYLFSVSIKDLS